MFLEKKRSLMIVLVASIAAVLLLCASALILLPKRQTAHAAGLGTPVPVAGGELEAGSYYLGSDFTIGSSLIIPTGKEVTLNLNGNVLKLNESVSDSVIHVQGTLTLIDGNSQASNTITSALDGGGDVTVNGGVITGGKGSGDSKVGGGVFVDEGGVFNMTGGMIAGNTGDYGGGVRVDVGATFTMTDGEIAYNKAERDGGGLCVCNAARVDLNGGSISNNAAAAGGGIYFEGEGKDAGGNIVYKINGADVNISSNTVKFATGVDYTGNGGGIYIDGSAVEMTDGAISYNRVENNGGGVYVSGGTFNMTGGTIERNTASDNGGGVYVNSDGAFNVSGNAFIYGNTKDNAANNVSLYGGGNIAVAGALSDGAKIGVVGTGELITGYKFNSDKPSKYFFADGGNYCTRVSNEADGAVTIGGEHSFADGECSTCGYRAAAKVDNAYYVTLEEAWAAAKSQSEATVTMFKDAEVGGYLSVIRGNNITLDLNGYMLKFTGDDSYIDVQCEFTLTDTYEGDDRKHDVLNLATSEPDDTMEIVGGVITGGQKNHAVQVLGGGTFNMTGGTIAGSANGFGGGVYVSGTDVVFNMTGGTITGNRANKGGGVCVSSYGTFNMSGDAVISGNSAAQHGNTGGEKNGGGVYVSGGTFNMTGGTIERNTASDNGGGVYVNPNAKAFNVSGNAVINGNTKGGAANNVSLYEGENITVAGALADAKIGVSGAGELITGYKFNSDKPSKYFFADDGNSCVYVRDGNEADGIVTVGAHDFGDIGICSHCDYQAAAKVGDAYYVTFEEAWAAANSRTEAVTVVMLDDAETDGYLRVNSGKNITLDLNGYMLKFTGNIGYIDACGEFTLTDRYEGADRKHDVPNLATSEPDDTMEVVGGVITGGKNSAVFVESNARFIMTGGTIAGNTNSLGGGVYVLPYGTFTMTGGTITGNSAASSGVAYGGGVCVYDNGTFNMSGDAVISGNSATDCGGGVYVADSGTLTMTGGTISGNSLDAENGEGGGVYVDHDVMFNVSGRVIISGNKKGKTDNNVQLIGNGVIKVTGKLEDAQGNRAHIAVTAEQGVVANGFCQYNGNENYPGAIMNPALYFSSDVVASCFRINYSIAADTDTVSLDMHEYNNNVADAAKWTVNDDGTQATLRLTCAHCLGYFSFTATSADGDIVKQVTLSPTCAAEGSAKYTVTIDNIVGWEKFGSGGEKLESMSGTIVATLGKIPHTLSQVAIVNATCTADGTLAHEHCSACGGDFIGGEQKTAAQLKIAALGHDYASEFTTDTAATCTQAGSKSKHCSRCDSTIETTEIPALGHDYASEFTTDTAATCTQAGSESKHCSRCDSTTETTEIPALGHDYGEWTVYRQATVDEFGEERRVCSHDDSHYESRQIPKRIAQLVETDEGGDGDKVIISSPDGFLPDIRLVVTEIAEDGYSGYQAIADGVGGTVDFVYDVTLKSDGVEVQPDGTITIRLRIPENLVDKSFKLFHLHGSVATDTEYTVDGGYAVITTDRLSEFVFVGTNDGAASPAEKSNAVWIVFIVLFSIIILCEVAYVALRKTGKIKFGGDK